MLEKIIINLTADEAAHIEEQMLAKEARKGSVLVSQGNNDQDLYFLIAGHCDVYRKMRLAGHVCALHIASLAGPSLLGEANLLLNQERNATVLASSEQVKYLILPLTGYLALRKNHPQTALKLIEHAGKIVAARFIKQNDNLQERMVNQAATPELALQMLKKLSGGVSFCKPETAQKLFGIKNAYQPKS